MSAAVEHTPIRPDWTCGACGDGTPWPCAPAKVLLSEEYADQRSGLLLYLSAQMLEALDDSIISGSRGPIGVNGMHERFLGWARHATTVRAA